MAVGSGPAPWTFLMRRFLFAACMRTGRRPPQVDATFKHIIIIIIIIINSIVIVIVVIISICSCS